MAMRLPNWKRFSLRTLFVLMTACCVLVGAFSVYVNPFLHQLQSLGIVNRLKGVNVQTPAAGPAWQGWLVTKLLGDNSFVYVTEVDLSGRKVDDSVVQSLAGFGHLEKLNLDYTQITDAGIESLRS